MNPVDAAGIAAPLQLRGTRLKNRLVLSPMCQYSAQDGIATDYHLVHLGKFAQGGFGLVFSEAVAVHEHGRITHGDLGLWNDAQVAPLRRITDFIRASGAVPGVQLAHAGRKACMQRPWRGNGPLNEADRAAGDQPWPVVAPSALPMEDGWLVPHELARGEIDALLQDWRSAAVRAVAAGFTVAEVHGAHGYLLHEFLSRLSNRRTDHYGGSRENRMRFPLEVAAAVRSVWPAEQPLFFRISAIDDAEGGWSLEDSVVFTQQLKAIGVDVIDCSSGGITGQSAATRSVRGLGFQVPLARRIRADAAVATMAVGLILDGPQADTIVREGSADLVAIGREALHDPNWALHAQAAASAQPGFEAWPRQYGWWLERRARALKHLR